MKPVVKWLPVLLTVCLHIIACSRPQLCVPPLPESAGSRDNSLPRPYRFVVSDNVRSEYGTTAGTLEKDGFDIAAFLSGKKELLFRDRAEYSDADGCFLTAGFYWHTDDTAIDFYAVHPSGLSICTDTENGVVMSLDGVSPQTDIVASKEQGVWGDEEGISLNFHHILGRLELYVKGQDPNVSYVTGSVSITYPAGGTCSFEDWSWTAEGESSLCVTPYPEADSLPPERDTAIQDNGPAYIGEWNFIPGTLEITVEWVCFYEGIAVGSYRKSADIKLSRGKITAATLLLTDSGVKEMETGVTVSAWEDSEVPVGF